MEESKDEEREKREKKGAKVEMEKPLQEETKPQASRKEEKEETKPWASRPVGKFKNRKGQKCGRRPIGKFESRKQKNRRQRNQV